MRRSFTIGVVLLAAAAATWFAYPPSRQWPVFSHVGNLVASPAGGASVAKSAPPGTGKGSGGRGAVPVLAATATTAEMPIVLSAPGTVEPFASVSVKPRVDGQISEIAFKEGDEVRAGDVLFRLDDRLINAQIRQAEANIARDKASLKDAEAILKRRETLVTKNIVTEEATETQRSTVAVLKAGIAAGEAMLEAQRTQLDYLTILAPIPGRTGALKAKLGSNVRATDTASALIVINQTRPISVTFSVPQVDLVNLRRALAARSEATIRVGGETPIETKGKVIFIDNQVDTTTGTLLGKVEVPNENEVLWPGQAVDVELVVERRPGYVAVPASAVLPSQQGMLAWVIGTDGKVAPRTVALERVIAARAYLSDGLSAGERVVTDGQLRLSPGATVIVRDSGAEPREGSGAKGERAEPDKRGTGPAAHDTPPPRSEGRDRGRT